ncbi:glycosyltransferase family protein [Microbacterium sp.]|uniref:glycosyltransferase family protein n=1 Tax=Microbacterium sp. TaxID=51671 RepID=UPI003C70AEAB
MNLSGIRARVRASREIPGLGAVVRAADRAWWFRVIRRSGLADAEFYAAQLGARRVPRDVAIWHYVARGFRRGLSLNPLFDEVFAGGGLPEVFRVPALYAYLVGERETIAVHPWWDAVAMSQSLGGEPALERVWADPSTELRLRVGDREDAVSLAALRGIAMSAARTWSARGRNPRVDGAPVSPSGAPLALIRFVQARDRRYHLKLEQAARFAQSDRAVASIALVAPGASQWISAAMFAAVDPAVAVRLHPAGITWARAVAAELAERREAGSTIVVLDARAEFADTEIEALAAEGCRALAIPAHRAFDGTLAGLGAAQIGAGRAYRILSDHPSEDIERIPDRVLGVPLATGRSFAIDRSAYREAGGVRTNGGDELEGFSRRLAGLGIPSRVLLDVAPVLEEPELAFRRDRRAMPERAKPSASDRRRAEDIIGWAGFEVRGWSFSDRRSPVPQLAWRCPHPGAQRWAIKICAPAGRQGAVWGDTHFARGLASALRRRGHTVVIDAYDARDRATGYLDDVSVVVRGPYRIDAPRWGVSLQWIISHPDEITRDEAAGFDRVFAASAGWSRRSSARWRLRIDPLLEATDTDQFFPHGLERGTDIVFVGTARGIPRPSVVAPLAAGIPVRVYGPDWRPFVPQSAIAAQSIPNAELPARYETASIVLNDQWPVMQREGFIAMRPFDAVAVGGRVISEAVEEIEELFGGAVVVYRDAEHLIELLRTDPAELFPADEQLARIAERIRSDHSFDARAATLEAAAAEVSPAF